MGVSELLEITMPIPKIAVVDVTFQRIGNVI